MTLSWLFLQGLANHLEDVWCSEQAIEVSPIDRGFRIEKNIRSISIVDEPLEDI